MLRYRAMEAKQGKVAFADQQLAATDRNGKLAAMVAPLANWATERGNNTVRGRCCAKQADLHPDAALPKYQSKPLTSAREAAPEVNREAPAFGRKAVLYATCFGNYNDPRCRHGDARRAGAQRRGDRGGVSALLRHAAAGARPHRRGRRQRAHRRGRR